MRRFERTARRSWSLVDEAGHVLGTKVQPKWYSQRAEIAVAAGLYMVKSRKMLSRDLAVFYGDVPILIADQKWTTTSIRRQDEQQPVVVLKRKRWFSNVHDLVDASGRVRASMRRRFDWKTFEHEPILIEENGEALDPLVILFAAHVIEVQEQRAAAAAS